MVAWHPSWDRLPYCTAQLVPAVFLACLVEVWPLRRWPMGNTRPGFLRVLQFLCIAQCMVLALYPFKNPIKTNSLALYVVGSVLAVSMVATCVELGFSKGAPVKGSKAKAQATEVVKAEPTPDTKPELVAEHIPEKESWTSALIVAITFSAAGAFAELGLGYLEAKFKFLNYGQLAAYYGWNVAALAILVACGAWLAVKGSVAAGKFVVVLAGFTFAITVILRQMSHGYYSIYSQQGSWLTLIVQVFILELGHLHSQGLLRWTRWDVPASATPPAVAHIAGSAAGAIPGIVSSTLATVPDQKGSMTGVVMQGATTDEILDAFDVFRSSSLDRLWGLHFGTVLPQGQQPVGEQIYRLPFQSGSADRKWDSFVAELAPSIECIATTGLSGKGSRTIVPGNRLLGKFQTPDPAEHDNSSHFTELGSMLMQGQGTSVKFGTCNVMVSSQTLRTQIRQQAVQEILFKLSHGYNKGLWPVLHKEDPSANLVMPSDAADNASRKQLVSTLKQAISNITSGRASNLLGANARGSTIWQRDGRVASLLQKLQIVVDNSKLSIVACPQPSLVSEKYMGTRMRMWGAVADSKELIVTDLGVNTPHRYAPVDFVFFVDEQCQHVAAVLVHAWLGLHQCSVETCLAGELLVEQTSDEQATVSRRIQQEIDETKPVDLLQALGRLAADAAASGTAFAASRQGSTSPSRQSSSIMLQHESAEGGAVTQPARAISFGRHGAAAQAVADVPAHQALACSLAEALQHRCFDYSVDTAWMSNTHDAWKTMLSSAIHKNGLNRRLAAATDIQAGGTMQRGAVVEGRPDAQVLSITEVVDRLCAWMHQNQCCTTGSLSILRQVQRCSLELTIHSLLHASVGLSEHDPEEFLSDSNVFVVYLEHMGIGNEVENWYGMSKFRLGRVLWNRYQDMRCDGDSLVDALPPGKGIYDLEKDDIETQESPAELDRHESPAENMTGFSTAVGNGIFWLIPFVMYFVPLEIVGFSLYDNGNLNEDLRRWLFWSFFCSFLVVGGYFNLLLHFINNHRWRFSGQAQLLAIAQSIPSAFIVYLVACIPVGVYAFLRSGWEEGIFSAAIFFFLSLELTMLMIVGSLTTDGNLWGSRSALNVIAVYAAQLCWNLASRFITKHWDLQIAVNIVGLIVFANVAGLMLCFQLRRHAQIWAEALQCSAVTDAKVISQPALQVLLSFHNAMNGSHETPDTVDAEELALICRKAAQTLLTKTKVLRRQRLSMIFDKYCWVVPQGALMHCMITITYWFGEWGGQGLLKDVYSNVLVMTLAYVITAGAFCEWCWVAKNAAWGLGNAEKHAMYMKTLRQLLWWCALIGVICFAFLLLLLATPTWIDPTYSLGRVFSENKAELYWFFIKVAGYTMMVLVRFDDIMGDSEPSSRIDALHMFIALCAAVGVCVPLTRINNFNAAPPVAVLIAGAVYLGLHLVRKWTRQFKKARKEKQPPIEVQRLPLSSLIGQPAFSNSTFRQTDLRSALHRLQATKSKLRHKLKPQHKAGMQVIKLLQDWSNGSAAPPVMTESDKAKQGDKPAVTDTSLVVATKPATKSLLDDAYPDMLSIAATALDFWTKGKTEVWVVPFTALNADTGAPQLYSLGVANPETSTMAIHVVASDVELAQIEAGGGEAASRRVAEALLFTTSITMLKATGQVSSMTLSRLDACMWENPESAGSLQQRLIDELALLPANVLANMVDRAPLALISAIWQQLMGQHSAVGDTTWKDTDLFADMGPTSVADAWQWLPLKARVTLVHYLSELPHLAGHLSNSPENREKLDAALQHLLEVDLLSPAERHALKMATELVVCGEEVEKPESLAGAVAGKQNAAAADSPRQTASPTIPAAVKPRDHFLAPDVLPEADPEAAVAPASPGSPAQPVVAPRPGNRMSFMGRGRADSLPRRVLRAYLAVEMLLEVQQAIKKQLKEGKPVAVPGSPSKAPPKAQKSHLVLDVSPTKPISESAVAVVQPVSTTEAVTLPGVDHGLSTQHKTGLAVADSIDAEFLAAQKAAHLTIRKAFNFRMQGTWRLLWLSLMGDYSFWQEAMHLLQELRAHHLALYPFIWPILVFLQAVAHLSQVMYNFLCRKAIWDVGGVWSWLVVAQKETINAVASYDVKGNLVSAFVITRQGLLHNYLSLVAGSSSQMQMQAPVNSFGDDLATPKKILEVSKAVMGKTFNPNDSLFWCQTGKGMCAQKPAPAAAISTAFMVRKTRTVSMIGGDTSKRSWLQNSGIVKVQSWLPVWQYHPDDKTSSVWVYTSNTAGWPTQKLTWGGVTSLEQGQRQLAQQTEPSIITSYGREGRLSAISTKVLTKSLDGSDVESRAVVGFHLNPNPHVEESAVKSARCKLETLDDGGVQMALQADLHYSYPVTMVAGKAARVSYTPATPEPESAKALLLPFAAQMHITVPGQEGMWQYLLIRTKPPGLNRKAHNLWPSSTQDVDCWYTEGSKTVWQKASLPAWLASALGCLDVPYSPSVWQEAPALPANLRTNAANSSVQLHTLVHQDTGLSRMLLWWIWKMGMPVVTDVFYPKGVSNAGMSDAAKSVVQKAAGPVHSTTVPPVFDGQSATTMDEALLRNEPLLSDYWAAVGWLSYSKCAAVVSANKSTLQVIIGSNLLESSDTFSQLAHNTSSLAGYNTVPGNAYTMITPLLAHTGEGSKSGDIAEDPDGSLHVVAVDSGTWPTDGGGVATCRELVLDYVQHVRWSVLSEIGNDFKQVQPGYVDHKTLDSVDLLIMWDGQYPSPAQNALAAVPYIDLSWRQYLTRATTIKHNFIPVLDVFLMVLLKSSFLSAADVQAYSEAIMQMWRYFQIYDWDRTWASPQVVRTFFATLNAFSQATVGSNATDGDLFAAYDAVQHYMKFICMPKLSTPQLGSVCHASNHGTQAMTGMIFKKLFNQALIVWDHCVYVRERLLWYDTEKAMPFLVRETLARLHRAAADVLYSEADLVTPCCATFNVDWEQWLGHMPETIMPVVNGLDFNTYKTVDRVLAERPTVVMMAHVNPLKDIVTAIRAAKLIVEEYGVTDYQLFVYGNKRQDERYCAKCERLIQQLGMQDHVALKGLAKPAEILRTGWIYLQSSISEGLPISILEAGMSGLCVVCTDVGGCAETMSDGRRSFGRLTSARNHKMVAYGQMEVMAMLPTLSNPNLSQPPPIEPEKLLARLNDPEVHEKRRLWGQEYKEFIKRKFSLFTHANQQRQAFYLTHYSRQICCGEWNAAEVE